MLILLAAMREAQAQPAPGTCAGPALYQNGLFKGCGDQLDLPATLFSLVGTGTRWTLNPNINVTMLGACIGAATSFCGTVDLTGKTVTVGTGGALAASGTGSVTANHVTALPMIQPLPPMASCVAGTASARWDASSATAPLPNCIVGTNTIQPSLDFDDTALEAVQQTWTLASDWVASTGVVVDFRWLGANTTNAVRWCAQVSCVADGATNDPTWNAAACVNDTAKGTTLQTNDATVTLSGTGLTNCAASTLLHLKIYRDAADAGDTFVGDARLLAVRVTSFRTF